MAHKVIVRLDAGFNSGELCDKLESDGIGYVMRLKENAFLGRDITKLRGPQEWTSYKLNVMLDTYSRYGVG